jgi:MFS transporter, MFS domain-containing protein family, molybdate-anion transporter
MANFTFMFWLAMAVNACLTFYSSDFYKNMQTKSRSGSSGDKIADKQKHANLLKRYLFVYLTATLSDWLQGPYVYALYSEYGFDQHEIAQLFVAGFGSSMIFGSFIGSIADWGGRRTFVILFSIVYAASCATKHFRHYGILMLGRLLGGVATSLLFSVFEAWLIRSHADADLPKPFLSKSFSWAAYGNSIIAISAGLVANQATDTFPMKTVSGNFYMGGYLNPFDLAFIALLVCGLGATFLWEENYGDKSDDKDDGRQSNWHDGLKNALITTLRNRDVLLCGLISSLFEGSMYIFVFMWTPLLRSLSDDEKADLPFGLIFSTFMVCCMAGSSLFSIVVEKIPVEKLAVAVFAVGSIAMTMVGLASSDTIAFLGMNIFEMCVGLYFPSMGTMKGGIVPEDQRAAIYNLYRIPLNFIVLFSLLTDITPHLSFTLNACMLAAATAMQFVLSSRRLMGSGRESMVSSAMDVEKGSEEMNPLKERV